MKDDDGILKTILVRYGETLLHVAAVSIRHGLYYGRAIPLDLDSFSLELNQPGAAFVTLNRSGQLRGCIGSPRAWRAIAEDVADNAFKAAFTDSRFRPLLRHELPELDVSVSLLTPLQLMEFHDQDDLIAQIQPGFDGLVLEENGCEGLLLPQVWKQLPNKGDFLTYLKRKAGLPPYHWSQTVRIYRFTAYSVKSTDLPDPMAVWNTPAETL